MQFRRTLALLALSHSTLDVAHTAISLSVSHSHSQHHYTAPHMNRRHRRLQRRRAGEFADLLQSEEVEGGNNTWRLEAQVGRIC